ncbi:MAG: LysM peptidoglycan-binding domain-containing protein, partial [Neptuniibacter sp.]
TGSLSVEGADSGLGYSTYALVAGNSDALEAGTYTVTLTGVGETEDVVLDQFEVVVGSGSLNETNYGLSWALPSGTDSAVVLVDGEATSTQITGNDQLLINPALTSLGAVGYNAFYGSAFADAHDTTISSTEQFNTDNSTTPPTVTSLGFNLDVSVVMTAAELANIDGDLQMDWRPAGTGLDFANSSVMTSTTDGYTASLTELPAGEYDIKLYYTDMNGDEVIVDWLRTDTSTANTALQGNSVTVQASELEGELTLGSAGQLTIDTGLYSGPVPSTALSLAVASSATGLLGDSLAVDGSTAGYFTESQFNALNQQIATNAETGLWREFGVDANGNVLVVENYGLDRTGAAITTFSSYDSNNREIARFGAVTTQDDGSTGRAKTQMTYDVFGNQATQTDARGGTVTQTWNAMGKLLTRTDQLANTTTYRYDRLGNQTSEEDALGNTQYSFYDLDGNMTQKVDGEGHSTTYTYDVFGRKTQVTNDLGQSITMTYDNRDRLISAEDALQKVTSYEYDGRDNRTQTTDANGHISSQEWDGLGRVIDTVTYQNGVEIHERKAYDAYGNLVSETDGEGRETNRIYGGFGRVVEEIDQGGVQTFYTYDDQGRLIEENGSNGKKIVRTYDDAGRLLTVSDQSEQYGGVSTVYTYDIAGNRLSETVTTPNNAHDRSVTYAYDAIGQMVRWADSETGMHTNYQWDAAGNMHRAFTDLNYDPDAEGLDANTRFIDHQYSYDGNNRIIQIDQRGELDRQFGYDAAGNRVMESSGGQITEYTFDANGRVIKAEQDSVKTADWQYDDVGNVLQFRTFKEDGTVASTTTKEYYENNRNYFTNDDGQQTTLTMDNSGRITRTKLVDDGSTYYFDHIYNASGLETRINARGDEVKGRTINTYDLSNRLIQSDKGEGDQQDRAEILKFTYNNDGQILYRFHDTGEGSKITETEYAYANGYAVGETGNTEGDIDGNVTLLDTGRYNLMQAYGDNVPSSAITFYTVQQGDDLQSIAGAVYGNPSLWFIIAEANGLEPGAPLSEGQRLQIPNTIESGRLTADTHVLYDEGEIIGSTLPNLKSDPPGGGGCGQIIAIIIVVVVAVVAVYATQALAAYFAGGAKALAASTLATQIGYYAAAGAIVGAAASVVTQAAFIALGYQDSFSWKSVAAGAISGAFQGAAQGLGTASAAAEAAGNTIKHAKVAARALQVAGAASKQLIENGKITSWAGLAVAGLGPVRGVAGNGDIVDVVESVATGLDSAVLSYVTPWLGAVESYLENGEITPSDWAVGIAGTLNTAIEGSKNQIFDGWEKSELQLATNLAVGGVLTAFDKDAGEAYLSDIVGKEIGTVIGNGVAAATGIKASAKEAVRDLRQSLKQENGVAIFDQERAKIAFENAVNDPSQRQIDDQGRVVREGAEIAGTREGFELVQVSASGSSIPTNIAQNSIDQESPLEALNSLFDSIRFGEEFVDGSLRPGFDERVVSENDLLFGLILEIAKNVPESQFNEAIESLGLRAGEAEIALSIIFGEEADFSMVNKTDPRSTRSRIENFKTVSDSFNAGEITRRDVVDSLVIEPLRAREFVDGALTRTAGGLQAIGGAIEVFGGALLSKTGLGAIIGVPLAGIGLDNIQAGSRQAYNGVATKTYLQEGIELTGLSESNAALAAFLVNLGVGGAGGLAQVGKFGNAGKIVPNSKYGSIPTEEYAKYDRYLNNKSGGALNADEWFSKAQIIRANRQNGGQFETDVVNKIVLENQSKTNIGGHIPDLPVGKQYGVTDIKNVQNLSNGPQLKAFYQYARENELPFNIIISPRTQSVSGPVLDQIRSTGGYLREYNPSTQQFRSINIGDEGYWRR